MVPGEQARSQPSWSLSLQAHPWLELLKRALEGARKAFMEVLEGYTLADLVAPRARLAGLLGISSGASPH